MMGHPLQIDEGRTRARDQSKRFKKVMKARRENEERQGRAASANGEGEGEGQPAGNVDELRAQLAAKEREMAELRARLEALEAASNE